MNKRGRKKKEKKDLKKFIFNTNIEYQELRDDFYYEAWNSIYEDHGDDTDVCFCDECIPAFEMAIHKAAWNLYKEMMKEGRDFTRIINLGRRKIEIHLHTDGRTSDAHWCLGSEAGGKGAVFNALTEEEKKIAIMHPHFHNY
jgi:hypothetical protein